MTQRLRRLSIGLALIALVPMAARAQEPVRVTGQVTDGSTLRPLPGVQVLVRGTTVGSLTDARGRYLLTAPAGRDSLMFTYLGYKTVTRAVAPVVNVNMEVEAVALSGLVVTALGIEREKRSIPFSAQTVTGDKLAAVPTANALSALQGEVAGIGIRQSSAPGGTARIVIRGESSITGNNQPLIVVDGVPIDNSAASNDGYGGTNNPTGGYDTGNAGADVNPNEIASVTVLKGPNAAALYGSRAANGAIVITTKSGTGVASDKGWGLSATIGTQMETPLRLPDFQNEYGQGFGGQFNFVDGNGGGVNDGADESWGPKLDGRTTGCVLNTDGDGNPIPGSYNKSVPCNQFFGVGPWVAHPNNVRSFFNTGVVSNLNVAVARSSERNNVRLSVGRWDENGMYPTNRNIKTDVGLNGGLQLSSRLSTEASVNYTVDNRHNMPGTGYEEINPMSGFIWFGRQVDMARLKATVIRDPSDPQYTTIVDSKGFRTDAPIPYSWNYSYHPSPYWMAEIKQSAFTRNRLLGHASATYKFNDWLSVTGRTGRDWYQNHTAVNYPVNDISPLNTGGLLDNAEVRSESNTDILATLNRSLTRELSLTINAGGNARRNDYNYNKNVVSALVAPGVYTMENSNGMPVATLFRSAKKVNSLYASANANYRGWLSVDLTGRNDWSSALPANANSFFYPSVGAAFIFTDALGLHGKFLNSGKLRASWTRVGNDTDPYRLQAVYATSIPWSGMPTYTMPDTLFNPNLKPEETTGMEAGTDLGLLNDRLVLNATVYQKTTRNQIFPVQISNSTGFTQSFVNAGDMQNRGIELEANITPVQTPNFRWNVVANWSRNKNKVVSLSGDADRIVVGDYWNVSVTADLGKSYGNLVGTTFEKNDKGQIVVDSTGLPIPDPAQKVLGNYNPDWVGGITNTFTYKALSLSLLFDGQHGGSVYSVTKWFGQYAGVLQATIPGREKDYCTAADGQAGLVVPNSVYQDGTPNKTPVCPEDYWHNSFYSNEMGMVDASYIKLRDARLSINLPTRLVQRAGFSAATLSLVGHNLALWTKQKTIDPETNFDAGNTQGVEYGQFPTARTIGFTLSVRP